MDTERLILRVASFRQLQRIVLPGLSLVLIASFALSSKAAASPVDEGYAGQSFKSLAPEADPRSTSNSPPPPASSLAGHATTSGADESEAAMMKKGMSLTASHHFDEAANIFQEVVAKNPNNVNAYYNLGAIAENKGDLDSALNFYKAAQGITPQDTDITEAVNAVEKKLGQNFNEQMPPHPQPSIASSPKHHHDRQGNSSSGSIDGAPPGYKPSVSYYGASPPSSITDNDPNYARYKEQAKKEHAKEVGGKVIGTAMRLGMRAGMMGLMFGLSR